MGSAGSGAVDYSIGAIVWVRRRNGSWWPGKVVGPDELGECDLTSPRTGTPVKLLGREDASVDWYNLEKSKRVKAFRCGEFDDCIERAEAAQGMPMKKREKYARREDAILHALELEKELLRKQGKLGDIADHPRSRSSGSAKKDPVITSEAVASKNIGKPGNAKLDQFLTRVDTNFKDECIGNSLNPKDEHKPMSEVSHSEATPRMRGLQDFGLSTVSLKRKTLSPVHSDGSEELMVDNHLQAHSVGASDMERTNHPNEVEQMGAVSRPKRSKCFYFPTEVNDPLNDKELVPNHIKMLEDDDGHPRNSSNEQNSSSTSMADQSDDSSETNTSDSDSSEAEADEDPEMTVYPDAGIQSESERDGLRQTEAQEHESTSSKEPGELAFSGERHHLYPGDPFLTRDAGSKWQLKGKRNIRHLTRNSVDKTTDVKDLDGRLHGTYNGIKSSTLRQRAYGIDDTDFNRDCSGPQMVGFGSWRHLYNSKRLSKGRNTGCNVIDWRNWIREDQPAFKGCCEDGAEHFNPITFGCNFFAGRKRPMLVDVDLKVQARYPKEPVPIVSLVSKLNGKAIIGRPIRIETLEDGSSETLVSMNDYLSMGAVDLDGNASDAPTWRSARRTYFRVPRPDFSSGWGGEDLYEDSAFVDQEGRFPFRKLNMGGFRHNQGPARKSLPHISRPLVGKKFPRKMIKKASSSINRKTRTLSSIVVQHSFGSKSMHHIGNSLIDGLIKPDTGRPTAVACIPVKLVFSRLLEKIKRPPSKVACKLVANRDTERQPS